MTFVFKDFQGVQHRKKRIKEIELISAYLEPFFRKGHPAKNRGVRILEFGCGDGIQIDYLLNHGSVVASDISIQAGWRRRLVEFVESDVVHAPFKPKTFDLIFSNHVLEHIEDLPDAFRERDRIGKPECLYAFAVPTDLWLLLSIPAQYLNKIIHSVYLIKQKLKRSNPASESSTAVSIPLQKRKRARFHAILDKIKPRGHGTTGEFFRCHEAFKIESWRELFRANGFHIVAVKPLLIYAPSELPIVPVLPPAPNLGLCSSVLFLLKRTSSDLT